MKPPEEEQEEEEEEEDCEFHLLSDIESAPVSSPLEPKVLKPETGH